MRSSAFVPPCIPTLGDRLPKGEGWLFEVKFDGYRVQVHKAGDRITLYTGNGADWTSRFPLLAADLTSLRGRWRSSMQSPRPARRSGRRAQWADFLRDNGPA